MKYAIAIVAALFLTSCTKTVNNYVYVKYDVPKQYLVCEKLRAADIPDPSTLTDEQISKLIRVMFNRLQNCSSNNEAVKEFIDKVNALADKRNLKK